MGKIFSLHLVYPCHIFISFQQFTYTAFPSCLFLHPIITSLTFMTNHCLTPIHSLLYHSCTFISFLPPLIFILHSFYLSILLSFFSLFPVNSAPIGRMAFPSTIQFGLSSILRTALQQNVGSSRVGHYHHFPTHIPATVLGFLQGPKCSGVGFSLEHLVS